MIQTKVPAVMRLRVCRLITRSCRSILSVVVAAMKRFPLLNTLQRRRSFTRIRREILKNPFFFSIASSSFLS